MHFSSQHIANAVDAFASLPGIGKKSALRLVLHLLKRDPIETDQFCKAIADMRHQITTCTKCHMISDAPICQVCQDPRRENGMLCIVESARDQMAIEETGQFRGRYHVLGGLISPIEGIGPDQLQINSLMERIQQESIQELVMALSPTIEGDTTIFYISRQLEGRSVKISTIARGVAFGGELEYADEVTLGRSILARVPYQR